MHLLSDRHRLLLGLGVIALSNPPKPVSVT
jgi:hypothetical protein